MTLSNFDINPRMFDDKPAVIVNLEEEYKNTYIDGLTVIDK
jgi:hypothetical protein